LARDVDPPPVSYEDQPLTRSEYLTALVHLYRGEMSRATAWRMRLDTTTNWAILTTAGLLAFSFRDERHPHWALLLGQLVVALLLAIEGRRYRIYDVWRSRVRKIEENFYGPILRRDPRSPHADWGTKVARDLLEPSYRLSLAEAMRARFARNYWAIFAVLELCWLLKVLVSPREVHGWLDLRANLASGFLPWWLPLCFHAGVLGSIAWLLFAVPAQPKDADGFWFPRRDPQREDRGAPDL
jgi:uncharacterized membrane protein